MIRNFKSSLWFLQFAAIITLVFSCQKDAGSDTLAASKKAPVNNASCAGYEISLDSRTYDGTYTTFVWKIVNPNPGNGNNGTTQALSHWNLELGLCAEQDWEYVAYASYRVGNNPEVEIINPQFKPDPSISTCHTDDVFKFDAGTQGNLPSYYTIKMEGDYDTEESVAWFKSGANTGCCSKPVTGIGCRQDEYCSFSQGRYFGSPHAWPVATVTIGGHTYTEEEGRAIRNSSNKGGVKDAEKAFTQLAAIRLSAVDVTSDAALQAAASTIDNWLMNYGAKLNATNLRNQTAAEINLYGNAKNAANVISNWIKINHCN